MNKKSILQKTEDHLRKQFEKEGTGHDWWHIVRVRNNARKILKGEKSADPFIVELGVLLHDIADYKFHKGDDRKGGKVAAKWLRSIGVDAATIQNVVHIVDNVVFKGLRVT